MDDPPDIAAVNTHTKGVGGCKYRIFAGHKFILDSGAFFIVHSGVITGDIERTCKFIDQFAGGGVNDGGAVDLLRQQFFDGIKFGFIAPALHNFEAQIGAFESGNVELHIRPHQLFFYIFAYPRRGSSGKSTYLRNVEISGDLPQAGVCRTEVVAPLADTVSFIDYQNIGRTLTEKCQKVFGSKPFRRNV